MYSLYIVQLIFIVGLVTFIALNVSNRDNYTSQHFRSRHMKLNITTAQGNETLNSTLT